MTEAVSAFTKIKNDPNFTPQRSLRWFQQKIKAAFGNQMSPMNHLGANQALQSRTILPGQMVSFFYSPKYAKELPYYDTFPLILPFNMDAKHFWGLNLHYLYPQTRWKLLHKLAEFTTDTKYDEKTRLALSWDLLSRASQFPEVKPCVKQYLKGYVKSNFIVMPPSDWKTAIFLPNEMFKKETKENVWKKSSNQIRGIK